MSLPVLDLGALDLAAFDDAARAVGAFHLVGHDFPIDRALSAARAFFELPLDERRALSQERSAAFRGWSAMRGARDHREQIHFGCERPEVAGAPWQQLDGPNQWPARLGAAWRAEILGLMEQLAGVGRRLLEAAAGLLALPLPHDRDPYLLLKLIRYPASEQVGVAPHCDFSWLTLLIQDGDGLSVRDGTGRWHEAPPRPGMLFVDLGELLEWGSRGRWRAAPHRVHNRAPRARLSLPLFVNPPLAWTLEGGGAGAGRADDEHVHRVLAPDLPEGLLHFGAAEWRRKGLGRWCHAATCCGGAA
jgi:isopenicillin N synthase-like dioxygenase